MYFLDFASGHGRIARGTWLYRTTALGAVCAAFGTLGQSLLGDSGVVLFAAIFVWCACALAIQRLHDLSQSGWWLLILLIPLLGPIWLFFQLWRRGVEGKNRYGLEPFIRKDYLQVDITR